MNILARILLVFMYRLRNLSQILCLTGAHLNCMLGHGLIYTAQDLLWHINNLWQQVTQIKRNIPKFLPFLLVYMLKSFALVEQYREHYLSQNLQLLTAEYLIEEHK